MGGPGAAQKRTWRSAVLTSAALVVLAIAASALVNPLLGRVVHWNIVAVLMPAMFILFTLALRKRWM